MCAALTCSALLTHGRGLNWFQRPSSHPSAVPTGDVCRLHGRQRLPGEQEAAGAHELIGALPMRRSLCGVRRCCPLPTCALQPGALAAFLASHRYRIPLYTLANIICFLAL